MADGFRDGVVRNRFGFYELEHKPTQSELDDYYSRKYYQEGKGHYSHAYAPSEIQYFRAKFAQRALVIDRLLRPAEGPRSLLDVGAGEGWALAYFKEQGWRCTGLDYSDDGCRRHNPDCLRDIILGDIPARLEEMLAQGRKFDVLWLDNVLEHLLDPLKSLRAFAGLVRPGGLLVIEVPNDFSRVQSHLLESGAISRRFWIAVPDHISYFNREGLDAVCREAGWEPRFAMSDFPIDFNLFNPATNYVEDKTAGRACHLARVEIENLMNGVSVEKTVELYRQFLELGFGRQIVGFYSLPGESP